MRKQSFPRAMVGAAALAVSLGAMVEPVRAQWSAQYEQFYMPAEHNWVFRRSYPAADRLFNAFDYGHAILYEKLWTRPGAPVSELEQREYDFVTRRLLVSPPRLPLEEAAIEVAYARLVPEAKLMFEWAHILHRQMYDVLADERLSWEEKDAEVAALLRYYKTRPSLAFSSVPKNMELMEGQYYSTAFREKYPRFNGLIWGYHWLQVGLYEPLMTSRTPEERQTGITGAVARFRQMLENAPENMPRVMPMTAAISPVFAARYPEAAIIFDNLHGMHDVISDILASPQVPRERKREEILRAAARYRDDTSFVMTEAEWREMAVAMGVQNMGGPVTGFLAGFPRPTVARGAVMAHGAGGHGAMQHGQTAQAGVDAHAGHGSIAAAAPTEHAGEDHGQSVTKGLLPVPALRDAWLRDLHDRMMADSVIRARIAADPELRRRMEELYGGAGVDHAVHATEPDSARVLDFLVHVLADAEVEARIHADPRLHQLWSDPEVQRRLAELRGGQPATSQPHRH
jgi:predicted DCC family thiol-disulfide oxidoreductase YuxK